MEVFVVAMVAGLIAAAATRFYDSPFRKLLSGRAKRAGKSSLAGESG
jgi:peptidoglycan/LPS O-acetylase OafA/YrhL